MAIPSFYYADLATVNKSLELIGREAQHALGARRLRAGQRVRLLDGCGCVAEGEIVDTNSRSMSIKIISKRNVPRPEKSLIVATAIPKGDRQRTMIDTLTQLGVDKIIPLECERSVTKYTSNSFEKWQRIAIEACKQSQNPWLPKIKSAVSVTDLLRSAAEQTDCLCLYADMGADLKANVIDTPNSVLIAIGPEGGFSNSELTLLQNSRFEPVTVANQILRTEAAAIAATAIIKHRLC